MWACRSLLMMSRPRNLLNSIHRRRAVTEPPAVALGAAASRWLVSDTRDSDLLHDDAMDNAAVSSPKRNDGDPGTSTALADRRRTATEEIKKPLYLVLDDVKDGFGIHKLDMDTDDVAAGGLDSGNLPRLPNPPVLRLDEKWIDDFAVLGSNVIGMGSRLTNTHNDERRDDGDTLTFDTRTGKLALLPDLPDGLRNNMPMHCIAAGDRLYVIEAGTMYDGANYDNEFFMGGLHCLKLHPQGDDAIAHAGYPKREPGWSWHVASSFYYAKSPWFWSCDPQKLPLSPYGITAHAVHPSGRAFFVSAYCHRGWGTFWYDTELGDWTRHCSLKLPFIGQAHYDQDLNAWVGLHAQRDGHICACDVPDLNRPAAPEWKFGKEKLFYEDPERHVDAKLVAMGGGGRFCIVEIMTMPGVDRKGCIGDGDKCVLRLTAFRVEYDDDGELTVTDRRPACWFMMSKYRDYAYSDSWLAFWA